MKKTLIALVALSGFALADTTPITLTNPDASDFAWIPGSNGSGITTTMTAENVQGIINAIPSGSDLTGWFGGTGQGYAQSAYDEIHITSDNSFTFCSRPALTGEYVMMGVKLPEIAYSITLSFEADKYVGYALFAYNGQNVTEIMPKAVTNTNKTSGASIDVTMNDVVVPANSTLYVLWSSKPDNSTSVGGGQAITVSNIKVDYIPEPATATLSLLALAGLASRRRRH